MDIFLQNHINAKARTKPEEKSSLVIPTLENIMNLHPDSICYEIIALDIPMELSYLIRLKYMESKKWRAVRDYVLKRDHHHCTKCLHPKDVLQCHHINYDYLFHEEYHYDTLITLCVECHEEEHIRISIEKMLRSTANKYSTQGEE